MTDGNISPEIQKKLEAAKEAWAESKKTAKSANEILDAYLEFAYLMRKHVDPHWS